MKAETKYNNALIQDSSYFADAVEIYRNSYIVLMDCVGCFPEMKKNWSQRPVDEIYGMFLHHKASWNSYRAMQRRVDRRGRSRNRVAYTMGVLHNPNTIDGRVVVYRFNVWEAISWHSGSRKKGESLEHYRGRITERFYNYYIDRGEKNANKHTVGLNLGGFFTSRRYPHNIPENPSVAAIKQGLGTTLIVEPSIPQIKATYGVWLMCQELFPNFDPSLVFGHKDSGKSACPGDTGHAFCMALSHGTVSEENLDRWIDKYLVCEPGYPVQQDLPSVRDYQKLLVTLGYDLGKSGVDKDGVDGRWGRRSTAALRDFEEGHDLLTNGYPDMSDYEVLTATVRK